MHKLVIWTKHDPLAGIPDREAAGAFEFEKFEQAELRALLWLLYCPNDIVMYLEIAQATCKHCNQPIKENAGWILHRWVHEGGNYTCWSDAHTKAEPKEPE